MNSRILFLLPLLIFIGCSNVHVSKPLIKEGSDGVDEYLLGTWGPFEGESDEEIYAELQRHPDGGMELVRLNGAIPSEDDYFRCFAETWNSINFLSAEVKDDDPESDLDRLGANYILAEYTIEDGLVSIWIPTEKAIRELVEAHPELVVGTVSNKWLYDCVLKHRPEEIAQIWEEIENTEENWAELGRFPKVNQ